MPKYKYHLSNGKFLNLEGDNPPSDDEVASIAKEQGVELMPSDEGGDDENPPELEKPGMLSRAASWAMEPTTNAPTRFAESVSHYINPNSETKGLRGIGSAYVEGLGHAVSGLTSPFSLATFGIGGAEAQAGKAALKFTKYAPELERIAQGASYARRAAGAGMAAHGAGTVFGKDKTLAERAGGVLEAGLGIAGMKARVPGNIPGSANARPPIDLEAELGLKQPTTPAEVPPAGPTTPPPNAPTSSEGNVIIIKKGKFTPEMSQQAKEQGYEYIGNNDKGDYRMRKIQTPKPEPTQSVTQPETPQPTDVNAARTKLDDLKRQLAQAETPEETPFDVNPEHEGPSYGMGEPWPENPRSINMPEQIENAPATPEEPAPIETTKETPEFLKAKPRLKIGKENYIPNFDNDVDKALFEIGRRSANKKGFAEHLQYVADETGMSREEILAKGKEMRDNVTSHISQKPAGEVDIPAFHKKLKMPGDVPPEEGINPDESYQFGEGGKIPPRLDKTGPNDIYDIQTRQRVPTHEDIETMGASPEQRFNRAIEKYQEMPEFAAQLRRQSADALREPFDYSEIAGIETPDVVRPDLSEPSDLMRPGPMEQPPMDFPLPKGEPTGEPMDLPLQRKSARLTYREPQAPSRFGRLLTDESGVMNVSRRHQPIDMNEEVPSFDLVDEQGGLNASGESAASAEAMSRLAGMKARGEKFVVYDRAGNQRPLVGPEAVDYQPVKGETFGVEGPNGFNTLTDMGGRPPGAGRSRGLMSEEGSMRIGGKRTPKAPKPKDEPSVYENAAGLSRALKTSWDMSAPLRQGLGLVHKPEFWKALPEMFKAARSEAGFEAVQNSIKSDPIFQPRPGAKPGSMRPSFAEEAGLKLTDLGGMSTREEALASKWAEKVPGVRASNRGYTAVLNKMRADTFKNLVTKSMEMSYDAEVGRTVRPGFRAKTYSPTEAQMLNPLKNKVLAKGLAEFVNTATGRGSLGQFENAATSLNTVLFAPRLMASRLQMMNPAYYYKLPPMARKEALKSLLAVVGFGTGVGQIAKMAGQSAWGKKAVTVEHDPASADFGKIKIGNVRIDPFGGFQQYAVLAQRMLPEMLGGGRFKSTVSGRQYKLGSSKFGRSSRLDVAERFLESKVNPMAGLGLSAMRGTDFTGKPFDFPEGVLDLFIPMIAADFKELVTEDPNLIPGIHKKNPYSKFKASKIPFMVPSFFGMSEQEYGPKR